MCWSENVRQALNRVCSEIYSIMPFPLSGMKNENTRNSTAEWLALLLRIREVSSSYRSWDRIFWLMIFHGPSRQMPRHYLKLATSASLHILSNSLFIIHPIIQRYTVWAADSADKQTANEQLNNDKTKFVYWGQRNLNIRRNLYFYLFFSICCD
jgi:hypothetical protein